MLVLSICSEFSNDLYFVAYSHYRFSPEFNFNFILVLLDYWHIMSVVFVCCVMFSIWFGFNALFLRDRSNPVCVHSQSKTSIPKHDYASHFGYTINKTSMYRVLKSFHAKIRLISARPILLALQECVLIIWAALHLQVLLERIGLCPFNRPSESANQRPVLREAAQKYVC